MCNTSFSFSFLVPLKVTPHAPVSFLVIGLTMQWLKKTVLKMANLYPT